MPQFDAFASDLRSSLHMQALDRAFLHIASDEGAAGLAQFFILYSMYTSIQSLRGRVDNWSLPRARGSSCKAEKSHMKTLRWLFVLGVALLMTGGAAVAQSMPKMVHAGLRTLYLAPIFVAMDRGIFAKNGVEVSYQELESGALSPAAISVRTGACHQRRNSRHCSARQAGQGIHDGLQSDGPHDHESRGAQRGVAEGRLRSQGFGAGQGQDAEGYDHRHHAPGCADRHLFALLHDPRRARSQARCDACADRRRRRAERRVPLRPHRRLHALAAVPAGRGEGWRRPRSSSTTPAAKCRN